MLLLGAGLLAVAGGLLYLMVDTAQHLSSARGGGRNSFRMGRLAILWVLIILGSAGGGGWLVFYGLRTMYQLVRGDWRKGSKVKGPGSEVNA